MLLKAISGSFSSEIEVDNPYQGVILTNIRKDSTIKVDLSSTLGDDVNRIPQLTIEQVANMVISLYGRDAVLVSSDGSTYDRVMIPFALDGVLDLSEDNLYNVQLGNLKNRRIDVWAFDASRIAQRPALSVQRADIKASLTEKEENVLGFTHLYFPNSVPDKIEFRVPHLAKRRKVSISKEQILYANSENRLSFVDKNQADFKTGLVLGTEEFPCFMIPVGVTDVTVHYPTASELVYYKVQS